MKASQLFSVALALFIIHIGAAQTNSALQSDSALQSRWSDQKRQQEFNLEDKRLGIQGYDPVAYFSGQAIQGQKNISSQYKGVTYRFTTTENKKHFDANPIKYEPAFGGWCAWAMAKDGDKVEIDPETYKIVDGRLFLFYNGFWGDTLKDWNNSGAEKTLTRDADANWKKLTE